MLKAREILRLKFEIGLSVREIGQACNCGKSTVSELLTRAQISTSLLIIIHDDFPSMLFLTHNHAYKSSAC